MYKKKLCLGTNPSFNLPVIEQIAAFKAAGFEGFFTDWQSVADRLNKIGYDGILTFELKRRSNSGRHDNKMYMDMPIEQYIAAAYNRACRVASLMKK